MVNPVPGYKPTTAYRKAGRLWSLGFHTGLDIAAPLGTPIVACIAGKVVTVDYTGSYGWRVGIESTIGGSKGRHYYCHMPSRASIPVSVGQSVEAGQRIGSSGVTGNTTGPHLHLELRVPNYGFVASVFRDPLQIVNQTVEKPQPSVGSTKHVARYVVTASRLSARKGAGTNTAIMATHPQGTVVTTDLLSKDGKWVRSSSSGHWYALEHLKASPKAEQKPVETSKPAPAPSAPTPVTKTFSTSVVVQNCASKRNDKAVGGKWVDRGGKIAKALLDTDASFLVLVEMYAGQRDWMTKALAPKYRLAVAKEGRALFYRTGRWTTNAGAWTTATASSTTRPKTAGADTFKNTENGSTILLTGLHLSYEVTAAGTAARKAQAERAIKRAKTLGPGRHTFAGDVNSPADNGSRRSLGDDVEPVFERFGYHDLEDDLEQKNGPGGYHLDRVFGGKGVMATKIAIRNHGGSDHGLVFVQFTYTQEA